MVNINVSSRFVHFYEYRVVLKKFDPFFFLYNTIYCSKSKTVLLVASKKSRCVSFGGRTSEDELLHFAKAWTN